MLKRPNILFFFSDQQRWDTVGAYGQRLDVTPNLDRMASEGVLFEQAITCQPVCGPARACLQTGRTATELGTYRNGVELPRNERTLAHFLGDLGYETAYVGKWHLASSSGPHVKVEADYETRPIPPERRGGYRDFWIASDLLEFTSHGDDGWMFDAEGRKVEMPAGAYRVDWQTDLALDYLENRRDGGRPFFLFLSYLEPHHQNDRNRFEGPPGSRERFGDFDVPADLEGLDGDWREQYPDYLGCCRSLDDNLGRLLAKLEELGLAEETLVVCTSDHGCHFRTRNGEYKRACHEACVHVPLVLRGPGFRGGRRARNVVSLLDLPPTLLEAAGAEIPPTMHGRPLQPLAAGFSEDWLDEAFIQISESQVGRALRTDRWKYAVRAPGVDGWREAAADRYVEDFLYDLMSDPHERENLAASAEHEAVRAGLRTRLLARMREAGEEEPVIEPAP